VRGIDRDIGLETVRGKAAFDANRVGGSLAEGDDERIHDERAVWLDAARVGLADVAEAQIRGSGRVGDLSRARQHGHVAAAVLPESWADLVAARDQQHVRRWCRRVRSAPARHGPDSKRQNERTCRFGHERKIAVPQPCDKPVRCQQASHGKGEPCGTR